MNSLVSNKETMISYKFLQVVNKMRVSENESAVRNDQFLARVLDECDLETCKTFAYLNKQNQEVRAVTLTHDQMLMVGMRESKAVRKKVVSWLKELSAKQQAPAPLSRMDLLKLAMDAEEEKLLLETEVKELTPKAEFCDKVSISEDAISIAQAAKIINTGRSRLMAFLRKNGWVTRNNEPYQQKIEAGLMDVKIGSWSHPDQGLKSTVTPLITGKGLVKLQAMYVEQH